MTKQFLQLGLLIKSWLNNENGMAKKGATGLIGQYLSCVFDRPLLNEQ